MTAACSLNHSLATLSLPVYTTSVPSKNSVQIPPSPLSFACSNASVSEEEPRTVVAMLEAVSLANAAAAAAKNAFSLALELEELNFGSEHAMKERRRGRRLRNRNKAIEVYGDDYIYDDDDLDSGKCIVKRRLSRNERSRYLTRTQEAQFSVYLKVGAMFQDDADSSCRKEVGRLHRRSKTDKACLRARECRERITLSYKRLVASIATPYQGKGLSLEDLIQEGCIGLLQGAQRFDYKRGYKLSTYVYWWIKQAIIRAVANKSGIVRLPGSLRGVTAKVIDAKALLRKKLTRWPTYDEISAFLKISVASVQLVCQKSGQPVSVDRSLNGEGLTLKDIIPGSEDIRPEVMINRQLMLQSLNKLLSILSEREKHVIELHYGLGSGTARSCEEIGRILNLSRERIRQIHWIALTKLREEKSMVDCFESNAV